MHKHLEDICELKKELTSALKCEFNKGLENVNVEEAGEVVDMIKDLAEAEEKVMKACYYEAVMCEMKGEETKHSDRYGYNTRRYASGRYAPSGKGHVSGYDTPYYPHPIYNPMMENMKMGYPMDMTKKDHKSEEWDERRYGKPYMDYQDARRFYTESHSEEAKERMERHANEHMSDTMTTIRDIYKSADPELKKRIKADLTKLVGEMPT